MAHFQSLMWFLPPPTPEFVHLSLFASNGRGQNYKYIRGFQLARFQLIRLYCKIILFLKKVLNLFVNWAPPPPKQEVGYFKSASKFKGCEWSYNQLEMTSISILKVRTRRVFRKKGICSKGKWEGWGRSGNGFNFPNACWITHSCIFFHC